MFTFLTALVELVGILLKSLIKSCVPHGSSKNNRVGEAQTQTSAQSHRKNAKCADSERREGSPVPKKRRRASITERTVSTTEKTIIYDLGSSGSPSSDSDQKTSKVLSKSD